MIALAGYIAVAELSEAYGSGAPYYGRATNMDKWNSPWPLVGTVAAIALALAFVIAPRRRR